MKKVALVVAVLVLCSPALFASDTTQLEKATDVINEIMRTPDKGIPHDLLNRAVCVGVVPSELKGAFMVGGNYGRGVLVCRTRGNGPWGAPSMFTIGGGSFGFQIGAKATDVVFLVMNPEGARKFVQDSVKLGAEASVAGGPVGRTAEGATDAQLHAEILSYSRTRGAFAGLSLSGAVVHQDKGANEQLYGRKLTARQILIQGEVAVPPQARDLDATLTRYSNRGGQSFQHA